MNEDRNHYRNNYRANIRNRARNLFFEFLAEENENRIREILQEAARRLDAEREISEFTEIQSTKREI